MEVPAIKNGQKELVEAALASYGERVLDCAEEEEEEEATNAGFPKFQRMPLPLKALHISQNHTPLFPHNLAHNSAHFTTQFSTLSALG